MSKIQNISVRFSASSNFGKVKAELTALRAQAASLGAVFEKGAYANPPELVNVERWRSASRAVHEASNAYRDAASSSGLVTTQQIRATAESERYTKALQRQKLTLTEMRRSSGLMKKAYEDQLRLQRMTAQYWGTDSAGRAITDITVPTNVPRDLDTVAQRLYYTGQMAKSASTQFINMGKNAQWAGRQLTVGFTYPMTLFGAAAGSLAYSVDQELTRIQKVYDTTADAGSASVRQQMLAQKELDEVRKQSTATAEAAARNYGAAMKDTLGIAADLAATGLRDEALQKSTSEVIRIATLGEMDYQTALESTIALQSIFKMNTDELTESFNYMNAVENATSLQLKDFAAAIPIAANPIKAFGGDIKEMGVLLTAMREQGIGAVEGANAIKASMQRLARPSKQVQQEFKALTNGLDIKEIVRDSEGLSDIFAKLGEITEDMSRADKRELFGGLFGSYQVSRMMAMTEGMNDLSKGVGQVSDAYRIGSQSAKEWQDNADRETKQWQDSTSGRFKRTLEGFKAELAKMGEPFLELATAALKAFTKVGEVFNGMDDWKKKAILAAAGVAAIAGPLVMMGGLALNLGGQFTKGIGVAISAIGRFRGAVGLMTTEEQAAKLSAEAQNAAMLEQKSTTSSLTAEVEVLAAAYREATAAAREYAIQEGVMPATVTTSRTGKPSSGTGLTAQERTYFDRTSKTGPGGIRTSKSRLDEARNAMAHDYMRSLNLASRDASSLEKSAAAEARIRAKTQKSITLSSLGMAAMAASTIMMVAPMGETTSNLGKWLMVGTIVVPAVATLIKHSWSASKAAWSTATGWLAVARNAAAASLATARQAGVRAPMAALRGGLAGLGAIMGPAGWIATGTAVVGAGLFKWYQHTKSTREEQENLAKAQERGMAAVLDTTKEWADATGTAWKNYKRYNIEGVKDKENKKQMAFDQKVEEFKGQTVTVGKGDEKKEVSVVEQFKEMTADEKEWTKVKMASEALYNLGMNANQAKNHMAAFLRAADESMTSATGQAARVVNQMDWTELIFQGLDTAAKTKNSEFRTKTLETVGDMLFQVFDSKNFKQRQGLLDGVREHFESQWEQMATQLSNYLGDKESILDMLIEGQVGPVDGKKMEELRSLAAEIESIISMDGIRSAAFDGGVYEKLMNLFGGNVNNTALRGLSQELMSVETQSKSIMSSEQGFFSRAADAWGMNTTGKTNMNDFFDAAEVRVSLLNKKMLQSAFVADGGALDKAIKLWTQPVGDSFISRLTSAPEDPEGGLYKKLFEEIQMLINQGVELDKLSDFHRNIIEMWASKGYINIDKVNKSIKETNKSLDNTPTKKTISIELKGGDIPGIINTAMSNVQQMMADSYMEKFNAGWDNTMAGIESRHEAAQKNLQRQQEDAQDAFDKRWEARREALEKEYEQRIKSNDKAIKAEEEADKRRQRIFEKEKARLQRLAEIQNRNIDYNMALNEGRLDDAAKIINTAHADDISAQMEAEQKSAELRSEARIEALEKKNKRLEKQRDKEIKELEKMEEAMRKRLQRTQQQRADALRREQDDYMKAMEKRRATATKLEEHKLETFKLFVPKNKAELDKWIKQLGIAYGDFGTNVLKGGKEWSHTIRDQLRDETIRAGVKVANDKVWNEAGKEMANKLLRGFGFKDLADFRKFVKTGEMSKGGKNKGIGSGVGAGDTIARHEGGIVDSSRGSRKGVAPTYKGLHRSEQMVLAQKGEYIVNKEASDRHRDVLEGINSGAYDADNSRYGGIGGALDFTAGTAPLNPGMAALATGVMSHMLRKGIEKSFQNNHKVGLEKQKAAEATGSKYAGLAGRYGGYSFSAEQMKNAAIIASVGSEMGMSARDIQIGIMTALAESTLFNLKRGHLDSLGLFQQRPSMGWGTPEQVTNPRYAARAFFGPLKAHTERSSEPPWLAAQHIQRSAFPDGSNYAKWWVAAQQIFSSGLAKKKGSGVGGGYVAGRGGKHRPIRYPVNSRGIHDTATGYPALDFSGPAGAPVKAVTDGVVTRSYDITGYEPRNKVQNGYRSYGRVIYLRTDSGPEVLYAHLSRRSVSAGARVKGGATLGYSGNTGNSTGAHLHFGATNGPYAWLRKGGEIKYDNTHVVAHRGETMLSAPVTRQLKENIASGGGSDYNVTIDLRGAYIKEDVDIEKAVNTAIDKREARLGRKRVVR